MADPKIILTAVDQTKAAIDAAKRNLGGLSDTAGVVTARLGTLGLAISGAFTAVTLKGAIDTLDMLDDLSEKTGIAVESLSGLRYAGEVTGTPVEALATGVRKLSLNMAEAAGGNKEAAATFAALGIQVKNTDGTLKSQDQVLGELADRFARYEDGAAKAALAQQVFGKSGADMIPLLNQGSAGIRRLTDEAQALGAVYGGELAKDAATFNDNLKKLELNAEAAKVAIAGQLLPTLNSLLGTAVQLAQVKGGIWGWLLGPEGGSDVTRAGQMIGEIESKLASVREQRAQIQGSAANNGILRHLPLFGTAGDLQTLDVQEKKLQERLAFFRELDAVQRRALGPEAQRLEDSYYGGSGKGAAPVVGGGGKGNRAAKEAERESKDRARLLAELSGVQGDYMEQLSRLNSMRAAGNIGEERYIALVVELIEKQPMAKKLMDEAAKSEKDLADAKQKTTELQDKYLAGLAADNEAIAQRNASLAQEIEEMGLTAHALDVLREMRLQSNIERERENLLAAQNIEGNEAEVAQIERRIELLQRQLGLQQQLGTKRINLDQREKAQKESEEYSSTLHADVKGALQRAFEDSRNPAEAFAKAMASTLYTRASAALAKALSDAFLAKMGLGGGGDGGGFNFGGAIANMISSAFGGGMQMGGINPSSGEYMGSLEFHTGGIVGAGGRARSVGASVFRGAHRYHTGGLAGDEVPAILKRREGVFTEGQMKALGLAINDRGGSGALNLTVINQTSAPIGRVTQRQISADERVLIIEEARQAVAADLQNPNSRVSRSQVANFNGGRKR